MANEIKHDNLDDLPALRKGWVRLVHRCIYNDSVDNIKENGLIFNGKAAGAKRGAYDSVTQMATPYNEKSFWDSMREDKFFIYDNAKYADTKIVFDMPLDEFCLLEKIGKFVHGKIDSKYIVGCVPNVNGTNKKLVMAKDEINNAEQKSRNNPPSSAKPNNVEVMIAKFLATKNPDRREKMCNLIYERINDTAKEFGFNITSDKNITHSAIHKNNTR